MDYQKSLIDKINKAATEIHTANLKGGNFMIVSPEIAEAILETDIRYLRRKKLKAIMKNASE